MSPLARACRFSLVAWRVAVVEALSMEASPVASARRSIRCGAADRARASLRPDYELRNDLNVVHISETKIAVCSQAAK